MASWSQQLLQRYGGELPLDYCCFDVETTGFSREHDLPVEMGHCLVYDGKVEKRTNLALNWVDDPDIPNDWLEARLRKIHIAMEEKGEKWHITMDYLQQGLDPMRVLEFYYDYIIVTMDNGTMPVFHNGFAFDEPLLQATFRDMLGINDFSFGDEIVLDTSALVKAVQMAELDEIRVAPQPNESMREYFKRIHYGRWAKGVKHNLNFCIEKFGLREKHNIDVNELHTAGTDAWVCHLLVEELREEFNKAGSQPEPANPLPVITRGRPRRRIPRPKSDG